MTLRSYYNFGKNLQYALIVAILFGGSLSYATNSCTSLFQPKRFSDHLLEQLENPISPELKSTFRRLDETQAEQRQWVDEKMEELLRLASDKTIPANYFGSARHRFEESLGSDIKLNHTHGLWGISNTPFEFKSLENYRTHLIQQYQLINMAISNSWRIHKSMVLMEPIKTLEELRDNAVTTSKGRQWLDQIIPMKESWSESEIQFLKYIILKNVEGFSKTTYLSKDLQASMVIFEVKLSEATSPAQLVFSFQRETTLRADVDLPALLESVATAPPRPPKSTFYMPTEYTPIPEGFKRFYHELGSDRPMGWKDTLVPIELVEAKKQSLENFFVVETVERFED